MWDRFQRGAIWVFGKVQRPIAWGEAVAGFVIFWLVLFIIATGQIKTATLMIALGLFMEGFGAVQEAEGQAQEGGQVNTEE